MKKTENENGIQRVGETIKALRERNGITKVQLCKKAKIDKLELRYLEDGLCEEICIETLISICPHLNVSLDYMLTAYFNDIYFISDKEHFFDFEGYELDLYAISQKIHSVDFEFSTLLSSPEFLNNKALITTLKEMILSTYPCPKVSTEYISKKDINFSIGPSCKELKHFVIERESNKNSDNNDIKENLSSDFSSKQPSFDMDIFTIAKNLYTVDAEFLILLSSTELLDNKSLISSLKEIILNSSRPSVHRT